MQSGVIIRPNSPLKFVTVPRPLFNNPTVAEGRGSLVSPSITSPVTCLPPFTGIAAESAAGSLKVMRREMMMYLSMVE